LVLRNVSNQERPAAADVAHAKAEKFQARVKVVVQMVTERIQRAMSPDGL
jgi:hypothetical protein